MAMTLLSGGGRQGYGSISSVVLTQNLTAAPYPEEKLCLSNIAPTSSVLTHMFVWKDLLSALWHSPSSPCAPLNGNRAPLCTSSFIALAWLDWAVREEPGRRPRGLLPLPSLGTRESGTVGSEWAQMVSGVILRVVG
uniref:Uncharacterized protein n=1 Tax=Molossus molossus TaxID=27622 RepID=A0A7J8CRV1_MOLMO|nr:hypothetical protein HJG59_009779 [Molossus molossus]